jgi:hypothetical protein
MPENEDFSFGRGALLATRFGSLEEFKKVVRVEYDSVGGIPFVRLTHCSNGRQVVSVMGAGVSEADLTAAQEGGVGEKLRLGLKSADAVMNRRDLQIISLLGRRNNVLFGAGDVAFFDLAEASVANIRRDDLPVEQAADFSEKGYLNTFNHLTAQAFMTSVFSERVADFMAMVHERHSMPELITGAFTRDQLADTLNNPVDNYVDMINNQWGQELGRVLKEKYSIRGQSKWTPELLSEYLNDIQGYYTWALGVSFRPFHAEDELVIRFSEKIDWVWTMLPR